MISKYMLKIFVFTIFTSLAAAGNAFAIQQHIGLEGFYVHQIGHLFFTAAMVYIYIVLRKPAASRLKGWRYIRHAAVFFILWNIDALTSHFLEGLSRQVQSAVTNTDVSLNSLKTYIYYITRLIEYFLLVPAFVLMAIGIYKIRKQLEKESVA